LALLAQNPPFWPKKPRFLALLAPKPPFLAQKPDFLAIFGYFLCNSDYLLIAIALRIKFIYYSSYYLFITLIIYSLRFREKHQIMVFLDRLGLRAFRGSERRSEK
jgi:hypothetical protein